MSAIKALEGHVITMLLLLVGPHHADVLGQEMDKYLQKLGNAVSEVRVCKGAETAKKDAL